MLYNDKTLAYIKYPLYRIDKTKMVFEKHYPIDAQILWPALYYFKFHGISHFVKCICKYGSVVNYNITYSETAYKYLFKAFYRQTN